jgi:acetamidase/formamidase
MNIGGLTKIFPAARSRPSAGRSEEGDNLHSGVVSLFGPSWGDGGGTQAGEKKPAAVPDYFGGNMDNKELVAGTTLYLPIHVPGALFSTGDAHAVQGDGEVNVTAIETAMEEAVFQFVVRKDMKLERPMGETPTHWITMGFHQDLDEAVKIALRDAIRFISQAEGLAPDDAYALSAWPWISGNPNR